MKKRYIFLAILSMFFMINNVSASSLSSGKQLLNETFKTITLDSKGVNVCQDANSLKLFYAIGIILVIIKILVPCILIIMGSIDFAKAALSGDDKAISGAAVSLGKRTLLGLVIFCIPTILDAFLTLVSDASETAGKYEKCTQCILNATSDKCRSGFGGGSRDGAYTR